MGDSVEHIISSPFVCLPPQDRHIHEPENERILIRLLCFPAAGTGAWVFHKWRTLLSSPEGTFGRGDVHVDVVPIELPGRNSRFRGTSSICACVPKSEGLGYTHIDEEIERRGMRWTAERASHPSSHRDEAHEHGRGGDGASR